MAKPKKPSTHKRTLTEAGESRSAPIAKRSSDGASAVKKHVTSAHFESKTVVELKELLKEHGLRVSGTKSELVQRLRDEKPSSVEDARPTARTSGQSSDWEDIQTWICICRPYDDVRFEKRQSRAAGEGQDDCNDDESEDDMEEDESENSADDDGREGCGSPVCVCKKPADELPEHKWIITEEGYKMLFKLNNEQMKRDQDAMDQYQYNDFTGYGFQEVVENHLASFNKAIMKKSPNIWELWHHIESFAHFLQDTTVWFMSDNSDDMLATLEMIGYATMSTLQVLERQDMLGPESPVRDLTLVLGKLMMDMAEWPGGPEEEFSWRKVAVSMLARHGAHLTNPPYGIEECLEVCGSQEDGVNWVDFSWKKKFARFVKQVGKGYGPGNLAIGGTNYDLSKKKSSGRRWW